MTDPNNAQPPRHGVIKRTIGGSLARSWPPPLSRRHRCCVLLLLLLGLSAAAAANKSLLSCCCFCCVQCVGNFRLLCVCTQYASCARVRQRATTKARSHQTDDRKLAPYQKRAGAFRPRISTWVRAPGCTRGESGRLGPRRPRSARNERKRLDELVLLFLRDNRTCPRKYRS